MNKLQGVLPLAVQMKELQVVTLVQNRSNMTMNVYFGPAYIDKFIRDIFPVERRIVLEQSAPVEILGRDT